MSSSATNHTLTMQGPYLPGEIMQGQVSSVPPLNLARVTGQTRLVILGGGGQVHGSVTVTQVGPESE